MSKREAPLKAAAVEDSAAAPAEVDEEPPDVEAALLEEPVVLAVDAAEEPELAPDLDGIS